MAASRMFIALASLALLSPSAAVTPVQKVVELLKNLEAKIEKEGKEEAAAYDKYACFCKEEVDDKLYAIEKSTAKIAKLFAEIEKLGSEITSLDGEIGDLSTKITDLKNESKTAQGLRDGEHAEYVEKEADAAGAIDACKRAIAALKDSKGVMGGKTELEASLVQVRSVASMALALASRVGMSDEQLKAVAALAQPGTAYEYKYHSNDIIATIENLHASFKGIKADLDQQEFDANAMHDKKQLSLKNERKFAEKEKAEKEALREEKTEEKEAKEADKTQETNEKTADENFMEVLKTDCETKASLWDQRSSTRAAELTAISEAMTALTEGVAPNWKANKKLVGLQQRQQVQLAAPKGHWVYVEDDKAPKRPASFLQLRSAQSSLRGSSSEARVAEKVRNVLAQAGMKLRSPILSAAALKVQVAEDHFVKVRSIIKDLVLRLEEQAQHEATAKSFCDTRMKEEVEKRDGEQGKIEDYKAQISAKEAEKAQLKEDIALLSKQIAENKKALKEATELREAEKAENEKTIFDAGVGKDAVDHAIQVLKAFYEGAALLQKQQFVPTNSDREGQTVADRAPEVFDADYKGSQDASKGIIGMLEVILSDFDRTGTTVTQDESDAAGQFSEFKGANELDTQTKEGSVTTKEGEITTIEDDLVSLTDDQTFAEKALADAQKALDELHSMCVAGEETYEERVAKRKKEIEALKEAHDILEDWQK